MWFKKESKTKTIELPAAAARVITQMRQVQAKFEREQVILEHILKQAQAGYFEFTAVCEAYVSYSYYTGPFVLNRTDLPFLENLGYKIEAKINIQSYSTHTVNGIESKTSEYTEYTITW